MDADPERGRLGGIALSLVLGLVGYFLSIGPVVVLVIRYKLPTGPFEVIYYPVELLHKIPFFARWIEKYIELWT